MKQAKDPSFTSNKSANVPEINKKQQLISSLSPKLKEKRSAKSVHDKNEPMVLGSPPTGESIVRYALPIPSSKTKELIAEDEMLRKTTKHLHQVVSALEEAYGVETEPRKKSLIKTDSEELSLSLGDDLNSFLVYCSQYASQLEEAVKEERNILESLFKWFQQQVNQMEELSKDQAYSEELPVPDKAVSSTIDTVVKHMQKLEQLRDQVKSKSKYSWKVMLSKLMDSQNLPEAEQTNGSAEKIIEEFLKAYATEELTDAAEVEPQTGSSVISRLNTMLKIFEKQSDKLERAINDQDLLEAKYNKMQSDFQLLSEEKSVLENELQKLKSPEKTKATIDRTKKTPVKFEKKKDKGKSEESEEKKSTVKQSKSKDFPGVQNATISLEMENKILHEQLKQALQEAAETKSQLDFLLNQRDLLKIEQSKAAMQMDISKIKFTSLDLDKERTRTDTGEQKPDDQIQGLLQIPVLPRGSLIEESSEKKRSSSAISDLSQILKSQPESASLENSIEVSLSVEPDNGSSSGTYDELYKTLSNKEIQDSLPVETSMERNETVTASHVLPKKKSKRGKASKSDVSEEKKQSKTGNQVYQEAKELQEQDDVLNENLTHENDDLKTQLKVKKQRTSREGEQNIQDEEIGANNMLVNQDSISISQIQDNSRRKFGDGKFNTEDDGVLDENTVAKNEDSEVPVNVKKPRTSIGEEQNAEEDVPGGDLISETDDSKMLLKVKKQRKFSVEEQNTQDDDTFDEDLIPGTEESTTLMEVKKQRPFRQETQNSEDDVLHEDLIPENDESKTLLKVKTKRTFRGEKYNTQDDTLDESLIPETEDSKTHVEVNKQRTVRREKYNIENEEIDENNMLENQESVSKIQIQVKKQRKFKEKQLNIQDEEIDEENIENQDSVSKPQMQVKKQRKGSDGKLNTQDKEIDEDNVLENQDSESNPQIQVKKQRKARDGKLNTQDKEIDEDNVLENQDSGSNPQIQVKKQRKARDGKLDTQDGEIDEDNVLGNKESGSNPQIQVKKQRKARDGKLNIQDEEIDEENMVENQDSVSKSQIHVKKQRQFRSGKVNTQNEEIDEDNMLEDQDSGSKPQIQVKKQRKVRNGKSNNQDEEIDEDNVIENQDSVSKPQMQVKKQRKVIAGKLNNEEIDEDNILEIQDSVSKRQIQVKKQRKVRDGKPSIQDEEVDEDNVLENQDTVSEPQIQAQKHRKVKNGKPNIQDEVIDEDNTLENQDSVSKPQIQVKKQRKVRDGKPNNQDEEIDEDNVLENQNSMSKPQTQIKKQRKVRDGKINIQDEEIDEDTMLENQDSVSKPQIQVKKQRKVRDGKVNIEDEEAEEDYMLENQDSVSKSQIQVKKQREARNGKVNIEDEVLDENLILENDDTETQMKVEKQRAFTGEQHSSLDEIPDDNLVLKHQDSGSKTQVKVEKQIISTEETLYTQDNELGKNMLPDDQDSVYKTQAQAGKQKSSKEELHHAPDKVPDKKTSLEIQDSESKTQVQVNEQSSYKEEKFKTLDEEPGKNHMLGHQESVSNTQVEIKKQITPRQEILHDLDEVETENPMPDNQDSMSKTQMQVNKESTATERKLKSFRAASSEKKTVADENLLPLDKLLGSKSLSLHKKFETTKPKSIYNEKMDELFKEKFSPEDKVLISKNLRQIMKTGNDKIEASASKKLDEGLYENILPKGTVFLKTHLQPRKPGAVKTELFHNQRIGKSHLSIDTRKKDHPQDKKQNFFKLETPDSANEELGISLTSKSLEQPNRYMNDIRTSEVDQSPRWKAKKEATSEDMNTTEYNLSSSPSIDELIVKLGLNKVIVFWIPFFGDRNKEWIFSVSWPETNIEHLASSAGKKKIKEIQIKSQHGITPVLNQEDTTINPIIVKKFPTKVITLSPFEKQVQSSHVPLNQRRLTITENLPTLSITPRKILHPEPWKKNTRATMTTKLAKRKQSTVNKDKAFIDRDLENISAKGLKEAQMDKGIKFEKRSGSVNKTDGKERQSIYTHDFVVGNKHKNYLDSFSKKRSLQFTDDLRNTYFKKNYRKLTPYGLPSGQTAHIPGKEDLSKQFKRKFSRHSGYEESESPKNNLENILISRSINFNSKSKSFSKANEQENKAFEDTNGQQIPVIIVKNSEMGKDIQQGEEIDTTDMKQMDKLPRDEPTPVFGLPPAKLLHRKYAQRLSQGWTTEELHKNFLEDILPKFVNTEDQSSRVLGLPTVHAFSKKNLQQMMSPGSLAAPLEYLKANFTTEDSFLENTGDKM